MRWYLPGCLGFGMMLKGEVTNALSRNVVSLRETGPM